MPASDPPENESERGDSLPRRPGAHQLGDRAVAILSHALPSQWIFRVTHADYGLDGELEVVSNELVTGALAKIQIKGTSRSDLSTVRVRVSTRTVRYWLRLPLPVLLVRVSVSSGAIRWVHVRDDLDQRELRDSIENQTIASREISFGFRYARSIPGDLGQIEEMAVQHQAQVLSALNFELEEAGRVGILLELLVHAYQWDIDAFIEWHRRHATEEQIAEAFPTLLWLREQIASNPEKMRLVHGEVCRVV